MRYLIVFFLSLFCTIIYSQNSNKSTTSDNKSELNKLSKKLVGKWKCDGIEITNQNEYLNRTLEDTPNSIKERGNQHFDEVFKQMVDTMAYCTLIFKDDKTMESVFHHKTTKGKWHLSSDGKELTTKDEGEQKDIKIKVVKFTKRKLVLYTDMQSIKVRIEFLKNK